MLSNWVIHLVCWHFEWTSNLLWRWAKDLKNDIGFLCNISGKKLKLRKLFTRWEKHLVKWSLVPPDKNIFRWPASTLAGQARTIEDNLVRKNNQTEREKLRIGARSRSRKIYGIQQFRRYQKNHFSRPPTQVGSLFFFVSHEMGCWRGWSSVF